MKILIVDDENSKVVEIFSVLSNSGIIREDIVVVTTGSAALKELRNEYFDLLIVDMYLPNRIGEAPSMSGGVELLKRIRRGGDVTPPEYIFGLTSNLEAMEISKEEFAAQSWQLEEVSAVKTGWKLKLMEKLRYLKAREEYHLLEAGKASEQKSVKYDLLLVCALQEPELSALLKVSNGEWSVVSFPGDPHLYWHADLNSGATTIRAIALCLPQMGLVAAGVSVSKAVTLFKPRVVAMSGICAGRKGDCKLGDAIGVNLTWDYGSGKFTEVDGSVVFEPAPFQAPATARVVGVLTEIRADATEIGNIYRDSPGYRPASVPEFHVAPMGSGAAVQNHKEFFSGVVTQQRKILGVDMEAFAVAWAAHEALEPQPHWLVIKSVVDFADGTKDSEIQGFGSYFSARLLILAIEKLFAQKL
ncbi:response regulator [Devosia sp. WQ 349]|nr:response regulator [Devosia sp. WQ 349K1]